MKTGKHKTRKNFMDVNRVIENLIKKHDVKPNIDLNKLPKTIDTLMEIDTSMKDCLVISNNIYTCAKKILYEKELMELLTHAIKHAIHVKTIATWANMVTNQFFLNQPNINKLRNSIIKNKNLIFVETYKIIKHKYVF
jgi:hypothetical protein